MAVCSGEGCAKEIVVLTNNRHKPRGRMAALIMGSVAFREHQRGSGAAFVQGVVVGVGLNVMVHFFWFDLADNTTSFWVMATILYSSPLNVS